VRDNVKFVCNSHGLTPSFSIKKGNEYNYADNYCNCSSRTFVEMVTELQKYRLLTLTRSEIHVSTLKTSTIY
jgi:hypothetical protein